MQVILTFITCICLHGSLGNNRKYAVIDVFFVIYH